MNHPTNRPITIATRGSALALAQTHLILKMCQGAFPTLHFDYKIIKTTGDKLQTASMSKTDPDLPKGLFTKELEVALLKGHADLAVHSLKDLPTELPAGLILAATPARADVRDVLIYRDGAGFISQRNKATVSKDWTPGQDALSGLTPHLDLNDFPMGATIATSSTRRAAQLRLARPDLNIVEIRGNVTTRMTRVAERGKIDATVLALAGISRLNFTINPDGGLTGDGVPAGLLATIVDVKTMLPCVGQGAIGVEIRAGDERIAIICESLNHVNTFQAVTAERAFLQGMGGGCQSPVAAYAEIRGNKITMQAVSFKDGPARHAEGERMVKEAAELGAQLAAELR